MNLKDINGRTDYEDDDEDENEENKLEG